MINYTGNSEALAIPVFADDMTTLGVDGMTELEPLSLRIFRNGETFEVNPVYSMDMPNSDGLFAINGLSLITSLKAGNTGIANNPVAGIIVYPNPSEGVFNIDGIDNAFEMMVTNLQGQVVMVNKITDACQLDLTKQPDGIYFIRLVGEQGVKLVKVIKQ